VLDMMEDPVREPVQNPVQDDGGAEQTRLAWRPIAIATGVGLLVRLAYLFAVTWGEANVGDAVWYSRQAELLARGHGFVDLELRAPGAPFGPLTPLLLAPISWIVGGADLQRLALVALGTATIPLAALVAHRLAGRRVAVITAAIVAVHPQIWINNVVVMSETVVMVCVALAMLAAVAYRRAPGARSAAVVGALVGLATLARSEQVLLVVFLVLPLVVRTGADRRREVLVAFAACALVLTPWLLHNAVRIDRVTLTTNAGRTLSSSYCSRTFYGPETGTADSRCAHADTRPDDDGALAFAVDHADRLPTVVSVRVARAWNLYGPEHAVHRGETEGRPRWASWLTVASTWVLLPFAALGLAHQRRHRLPLAELAGPIALVTAVVAVLHPLHRYRASAELAVVVLAAIGASTFSTRSPDRSEPTP
jgi:4-amino-4-deoxy-L-arabinose transferase-like glycosyltransferase